MNDARALTGQVKLVDCRFDDAFYAGVELRLADLSPALAGYQRCQVGIATKPAQKRIDMSRTAAEFARSGNDRRAGAILVVRQSPNHRQAAACLLPGRRIDGRKVWSTHGAITCVSRPIGRKRSTTSARRAMSRHTTAKPASRGGGIMSTRSPKVSGWSRAAAMAIAASSASIGAKRSGRSRLAASSCGPRIDRSVTMRNRTPFSSAHSRAAWNAGRSRGHCFLRSCRYLISTRRHRP